MSFNGSGTFNINTAGQPVVNGTTITDTAFNALIADLASGLTNAVTRDGQSPATANLPMGNNKHTGVSDATARTHYCSAGQAQDNTFDWLTSVSGADTITASAAIGLAAYAAGQCFRLASAGANTGAVTLNVNSLGAKAVTKNGTTALVAGDIPSGAAVEVIYDGTRFQLIRGGAMSGANSDITSMSALTEISTAAGVDIHGTNTNDSAAAGYVGEYIESSVPTASAVSAGGTTVYTVITQISLDAGDWDISGSVVMVNNGSTISGVEAGYISTDSGNNATGAISGKTGIEFYNNSSIANSGVTFPQHRVSLSGAQTLYLKGYATYSAGTPKFGGFISARRVR